MCCHTSQLFTFIDCLYLCLVNISSITPSSNSRHPHSVPCSLLSTPFPNLHPLWSMRRSGCMGAFYMSHIRRSWPFHPSALILCSLQYICVALSLQCRPCLHHYLLFLLTFLPHVHIHCCCFVVVSYTCSSLFHMPALLLPSP